MPVRKGGWWYYTRTVEGKQYAVHCRRAVTAGETTAADDRRRRRWTARRSCSTGTSWPGGRLLLPRRLRVSPDGTLLAYSTDFAGDERFTLRVKDLGTGEVLADEIPGIVLRLRLVGRRLRAVLHHRRRGLAAVPGAGGTWSAPRPTTT